MSKVAPELVNSGDGFYLNVNSQAIQLGSDLTFATARHGGPSLNSISGFARVPKFDGTALNPLAVQAQYATSRGGANFFDVANIGFDTSNITTRPVEASLTFYLDQAGSFTNFSDLTSKFFILAAVQGASLSPADAIDNTGGAGTFSPIRRQAKIEFPITGSFVGGATVPQKYFYAGSDGQANAVDFTQSPQFEGFVSGSSFATQGRFYCDPQAYSTVNGGAGTQVTIQLNDNALADMTSNDHFYLTVSDYSFLVLNQDPKVVSDNPGSGAKVLFYIKMETGSGGQKPPIISFTPSRVKDEPPDKKRIDENFIINSFADITQQRTRFTKNGVVLDQVPFLLGTKGPLSLRGREFGDDGKPISTAVDPPRTKKDSKS
jgi:hypothetical protein